ncbi:MAG: hypothetical protein SV062_14320 [Thermodesulfobacteriota bacterium]|nr:hypothetical protein [Thermodesulfobacteriota bacterium]
MKVEGKCRTTAMGIMPHTDVEKALELALSLDVPFWPQLPLASFYEDMWVQMSEGFPGITIDTEQKSVNFDSGRFQTDLYGYAQRIDRPEAFALSLKSSMTFHKFLKIKLDDHPAIRGQVIGPVNFGFRVVDENKKPIIYNEDVRSLLFDFIQRKVNVQYRELVKKNGNAFVWLDEPGLGWVFNSFSGYTDIHAKEDYRHFLSGIEGPKALHLCLNVNLHYLLGLGFDIISMDAYQMDVMPKGYAGPVAAFIGAGGIISWGIVPTSADALEWETPDTLAGKLIGFWEVIARNSGKSVRQIAEQAMIAPAKCCIKNVDKITTDDGLTKQNPNCCKVSDIEEIIVEKAFLYVRQISEILKAEFSFCSDTN